MPRAITVISRKKEEIARVLPWPLLPEKLFHPKQLILILLKIESKSMPKLEVKLKR